MFVAMAVSGRLVTLRNHAQARALRGPFVCPACHQPVGVRNGRVMPAHFYHRGPACAASEPESAEHLNGKLWLLDYGARHGFAGTLEQYYPAIKQRADVVWWPAGKPLVVEFQCSPLSPERLGARTAGYHQLGLPVVWVMGQRYFDQLPSAKQAKFLAHSQAHGWHLWFLDVVAGHLTLWQFAPLGLAVTRFWPDRTRQQVRAFPPASAHTALGVQRALMHRDRRVMALQQASAAIGRNVAGVPWVVHTAQTHLLGLAVPEWQLRAWWLLTFDAQPAITKNAETTFWRQFETQLTPLVDSAQVVAAIRHRWLMVLQQSGALQATATGWAWQVQPAWYPTLEAKLEARAQ
ncbi:competence protein CoiA [Lacticaseibacillus daqingensis]|uniref:competence protein CoiA n=1 Tax=Lacticaseibacillus daqingensis TaxID=2486014 RepID=UPI000F797213|nr:competence protein CoiA family protein [Lacticaseibacillus daqingensis]